MQYNLKHLKKGMKDGMPIALGYLSVAFTFGLVAVNGGLSWWQATLISMANTTSAGQFAGLDIMLSGGALIEMVLAQLVINIRYSLMAIGLSQNVNKKVSGINRWLFGACITDEIFAVSVSKDYKVGRGDLAGVMVVPYLGWSLGTLLGALIGGILPTSVIAALGIAIYGMFIAIVVPKAKEDRNVLYVSLLAILISCGFKYIPGLNKVSSGFVVIICAVAASLIGTIFFPEEVEKTEEDNE